MLLGSESGDYVEVSRAVGDEDAHGPRLRVRVQFRGFSGRAHAWVEIDAWHRFTRELVLLEERRQGEAKLASMSPGALELRVYALDSSGHMGVEGAVACIKHDARVSMQFSAVEFPPSQLVSLKNEAMALCGTLP